MGEMGRNRGNRWIELLKKGEARRRDRVQETKPDGISRKRETDRGVTEQ